jgi:hypothetical protein
LKRSVLRRPSPATAISCLALFVALGGVSYGVATNSIDSREIADNTVRSKDIRNNNILTRDLRNNDIRGLDIRNNTLRGRDLAPNTLTDDQIDESKLTQVPSSLNADRLGGVAAADYARALQESVRIIGASGEPDFESGYAATGGDDLLPGFWKDAFGVVHLQGSVVGGGGTVFTLPTDYRPAGTARFLVPTDGSGPLEIEADGSVVAPGSAALDGVSFRAG